MFPAASPDWLYYTREDIDEGIQLGRFAGNALNAFQAIPGYRLVPPETPNDAGPFLLSIRLVHGFSRWPVGGDPDRARIGVEGGARLHWVLYKGGEEFARGRASIRLKPFEVPVDLVRPDNVARIVGESLTYQFEKAVTGVLDEMLFDLAELWKRYAR